MAKKGTHGYFEDENKDTSFDEFKTNMTNIDDEVDRILAEQRKAKQQIDFFSDEPIENNEDEYVFDNSSSRELKSNSPRRNTYQDNTETEENHSENTETESNQDTSAPARDSGESSGRSSSGRSSSGRSSSGRSSGGKSSKDKKKKSKKKDKDRGKSHSSHDSHRSHESHSSKNDDKKPKEKKEDKSSRRSDKNNGHSEKKKHTGLKAFIIIIIILGALCGGVYAYFGHIPTKEDIQSILPISNSAEPTSSTSIHETLVVVTVSGDTVTYNGEVLGSVDELDSRLSQEKDLTLSLINNDANAATYNKVANIMNNYGGNFELMDENNTNPSINTEENTTQEESTENTTESVAESTTEPTSDANSSAE